MSVDDIVNQITGKLANDGAANYIQLATQIKYIGDITQLILGILVAILVIGLPIVIAIEVCYINYPIVQESLEKIVVRSKGNLNKVLGLTIRDARTAVRMADTIETGRSVNLIYLKIKCKSIFIAFFIVGLVLGIGPSLVQLVMKLAKAILLGFTS